jgi:hypothetical protein
MKKLILAIILLFSTTAQAAVTVNNTRDIDGTKQWAMVTLTVDGDVCRYTTVQPWNTAAAVLSGEDLEAYANSREDWLKLNILKQMYPNARPADSTLEAFETWIAAGHTNAAYCNKGRAYCDIEPVQEYCEDGTAYCTDSVSEDQETCEAAEAEWITTFDTQQKCGKAEGIWHPYQPRYPTQDICEVNEGTWITSFETEETCLIAGGQWIPETVITKVPWVDSHEYTGTLKDRTLETLNTEFNAYLQEHYDMGTQQAFQALYSLPTTPQAVKDALLPVWTWIQSVTQYYYGKKIAIRDGEDWESVTWDYSQFDATDPEVSLESIMSGS